MRSPSSPHFASPSFQSCLLACSRHRRLRSTHGAKSSGARFGNVSSRLRQIAFGIDDDRGDAVDGGFFEKRDAETGLATAGHADADSVRDEIFRVVEQQIVVCFRTAEIKDA